MSYMRGAFAVLLVAGAGASCRSSDAPPATLDGPPTPIVDAPPPPPIDAPNPDGVTITPGAPNRILLLGTIVTPDTQLDGAVLVVDDTITCVDTAGVCAAAEGATGATVITTKGIISPGLIDTHNHILFDIFDNDDWLPLHLYEDHDQWPAETRYMAMLDVKQCLADDSQGKPSWCAGAGYGSASSSLRCEMDKFGELKGLIAGTTSIVGLPGTSAACFGSLARSIDVAQNELDDDKVQTSALFPPSNPTGVCANYADGKTTAFLVHAGEGTDAKALGEFAALGSATTPPDCLYAPGTAITHGTAFTETEFGLMGSAGMKLIWSPQSNVSLYGTTTNIPAALDANVTVAIAPDWSMGGSQNMLDELRFADAWDNANWNDRLTAQDLVAMGTSHGAQALALDDQLGHIAVGHKADIAVFAGDVTKPYDAILAARPKDVRLVMVGGVVLYGDTVLQAAGPSAPGCEALDVCGTPKFLCAATTATTDKLDQSYVQISLALGTALTAADTATPDDGFTFAPLPPLVHCDP